MRIPVPCPVDRSPYLLSVTAGPHPWRSPVGSWHNAVSLSPVSGCYAMMERCWNKPEFRSAMDSAMVARPDDSVPAALQPGATSPT
jgi:hypothetical protein